MKKIYTLYKTSSIIFMNMLVFVCVTALLILLIQDHKYQKENLNKALTLVEKNIFRFTNSSSGTLSKENLALLVKETWLTETIEYESFTQFKERPRKGRFVNVDTNGFRKSIHQGPWPPDSTQYTIFIFGGSTIFGHGVDDDGTAASFLQEKLRQKFNQNVNVYNFGRSFYYSSQERLLFEQLLIAGFIPDMVIFIDGFNEFSFPINSPAYTKIMRNVMGRDPLGKQTDISPLLIDPLPIGISLWETIDTGYNLSGIMNTSRRQNNKQAEHINENQQIGNIISRYFNNVKMIRAVAEAYNIKSIFVIQPIAIYNAADKKTEQKQPVVLQNHPAAQGYSILKKTPSTADCIWCADLQNDTYQNLYVDEIHYNKTMNEKLAACIENFISDLKE